MSWTPVMGGLWLPPAIGAAAGCGTALWPQWRRTRRARTLLGARGAFGPPGGRPATDWRYGRLRRLAGLRPAWLVPELLLLPVGLLLARWTDSPVPVLGAALAVVPLRRFVRSRYRAAEGRRRAAAVIDLCAGLAAELRSGATPEQALHTVTSRTGPALGRTLGREAAARLAAGRYGGDVPAALRLVAELPGGQGAAAVAACWQVSAESGTGLAVGLEQVADALRAERTLAEEISGELAGPRTTTAVLAALPVIGMCLGAGLGASPVHILLHTAAGLVCLAVGVLFEAIGLVWTARIVRAAEAPPTRPRSRAEASVPVPRRGDAAVGCGLSRVRATSGRGADGRPADRCGGGGRGTEGSETRPGRRGGRQVGRRVGARADVLLGSAPPPTVRRAAGDRTGRLSGWWRRAFPGRRDGMRDGTGEVAWTGC